VRKADNLPPSCADVKKSAGLNLLEPCGPVQACNVTALPLPCVVKYYSYDTDCYIVTVGYAGLRHASIITNMAGSTVLLIFTIICKTCNGMVKLLDM
jgi:hypothetical protein